MLYLRDLRDAEEIRRRMARGGRAVVVDAGWIGSEVAASPRQAGLEVTVLEPAQVPLERVLGLGMSGTLTVGGRTAATPPPAPTPRDAGFGY